MNRGLAALIRMNEWTVNERRRELGARLRELEELEARIHDHEEQLKQEQHTAAVNPETAGFIYGNYAEGFILDRAELQKLIKGKEEEIVIAQGSLGDAYQELKKYEVLHENQRTRALADLAREEQLELDELGLRLSSSNRPV